MGPLLIQKWYTILKSEERILKLYCNYFVYKDLKWLVFYPAAA